MFGLKKKITALKSVPSDEIFFPGNIIDLNDSDNNIVNDILPWTTFIDLKNGKKFGKPYSAKKRNKPQQIPDRRIVELDKRYGLANKTVLELGCLEGVHTTGIAGLAKAVIGVDARIENVIKTLVRLWAYKLHAKADLFVWDVEKPLPNKARISCDILHHNGVLYHLHDPVAHLNYLLPAVKKAVMLDTHIARDEEAVEEYKSKDGKKYKFKKYGEKGRADPFSGMYPFSRWLQEKDLVKILKANGFNNIDVAERRDERNGFRILIYAHR